MATLNLRQKLGAIQTSMKAPKNLVNTFGKYNYRNAEGILEAFKPYEKEYGVSLLLEDSIQLIGDRFYVMASATIMDNDTQDSFTATAYAREQEEKRGMDASQITGSASSYARKYALNGLFLLDDTKDADSDEQKIEADARARQTAPKGDLEPISDKELETLTETLNKGDIDLEFVCGLYGVKALKELTKKKYNNITAHLAEIKQKQEEKNNE